MNKIAILADRITAEIFRVTDLHVVEVEHGQNSLSPLEELVRGDWEIIFITENLARDIADVLPRYQQGEGPVVVVIPGVGTRKHLGAEMMQAIEKSVIGM